jgi:hypothetical protein
LPGVAPPLPPEPPLDPHATLIVNSHTLKQLCFIEISNWREGSRGSRR